MDLMIYLVTALYATIVNSILFSLENRHVIVNLESTRGDGKCTA
ncbi:MAG: hypothetical protein QXK24_02190 [Ignisphaera sp.]